MKRILETRALPILIEKRNDLLEEMEALTLNAEKETRAMNKKEVARFNEIKEEINTIDDTLKAEEEQRNYIMTPGKKKENSISNDKELRVFKEGEKLQVETRGNDSNLSMGKLVRAMAGVETDI